MLRVFVDSSSSIKQEEKENYNIEIIPLRVMLGENEYLDGVDLTTDEFYEKLIKENLFPKTSLPRLDNLKEEVENYTQNGDEVLILTLSSDISGTFSAISSLFRDNASVRVVDSRMAVGGIRILVEEVNKYRDRSIDEIVEKINALIPRVRIVAIPENLDYLFRGGRLSRKE